MLDAPLRTILLDYFDARDHIDAAVGEEKTRQRAKNAINSTEAYQTPSLSGCTSFWK
jgi:hypothetical protein